jgi:hypothetical protein
VRRREGGREGEGARGDKVYVCVRGGGLEEGAGERGGEEGWRWWDEGRGEDAGAKVRERD